MDRRKESKILFDKRSYWIGRFGWGKPVMTADIPVLSLSVYLFSILSLWPAGKKETYKEAWATKRWKHWGHFTQLLLISLHLDTHTHTLTHLHWSDYFSEILSVWRQLFVETKPPCSIYRDDAEEGRVPTERREEDALARIREVQKQHSV